LVLDNVPKPGDKIEIVSWSYRNTNHLSVGASSSE
jgi:hypothetical protein